MFYPDCGFQILKTASPNLVLFTIYKHLLSSAYPKTSLQLAHSVTHLSDTWQALSPETRAVSALRAHLQRVYPQLPPHAHAQLPTVPHSCIRGAFAFFIVCVVSVLPYPLANQFTLPQTS